MMTCPDCGAVVHECDGRAAEDAAFQRSLAALQGRRAKRIVAAIRHNTPIINVRVTTNAIGGPPTIPPRGVR